MGELETFNIVKNKVIDDFVSSDPHFHAFFSQQIIENELINYNVTIQANRTEQEKRSIIIMVIQNWDNRENINKL